METDLANIETEAIIRNVAFQGNTNTGNTPIKVLRLAQFTTGECVMFSRHYKAYVIQNDVLVEKRTTDLVPGDELVFSSASTEMSDIIDVLLMIGNAVPPAFAQYAGERILSALCEKCEDADE